ncbi:MAG: hypothetical protein HFH40_00525 [Lachnospiraceae bacterium]|nr:hypothetical protein [Lachnospiraceae bacterium]
MCSYEHWLQIADDMGFQVAENAFFESHAKGLISDKFIGLNKEIETTAEKKCILAEEIGHSVTGVGSILSQKGTWDCKQEQQARLWAYNRLIGLNGIINSHKNGCQNLYEMAEYLDVTETFLADAIERYRSKYGMFATLDNYIIYFEPCLAVAEINNNQ